MRSYAAFSRRIAILESDQGFGYEGAGHQANLEVAIEFVQADLEACVRLRFANRTYADS